MPRTYSPTPATIDAQICDFGFAISDMVEHVRLWAGRRLFGSVAQRSLFGCGFIGVPYEAFEGNC